jgi:hypothetical protein
MLMHRQRPRYDLAILVEKQRYLVSELDLLNVSRTRTDGERDRADGRKSPRSILHVLDTTAWTGAITQSFARHCVATNFTRSRSLLT